MNKLSVLVMSIFLMLAAAMWYLASASFEEHIKQQINEIGLKALGVRTKVENISQAGSQTRISTVKFYNKERLLAHFNDIKIILDNKSLKEEVFIIESITLDNVDTLMTIEDKETFVKHIQQYFVEQEEISAKQPLFRVKELVIGNEKKDKLLIELNAEEQGVRADFLFINLIKLILLENNLT